ncbi:hypothetical protein ABZ920_07985 [Streptomyces sp. NPDC046831]|uniref:hypothetical protein n=1 Tax=Streptomyces sp. NPDC046831 TaxID=3154805 RepID=UPI0033FB499A
MIQQVMHETPATVVATDTAAVTISPSVPDEPHRPATRIPEVAVPELMGLRTSAVRHHRHKVPLMRLTAVRGC